MEKSNPNTIESILERLERLEQINAALTKCIVNLSLAGKTERVRVTRSHEEQSLALKANGLSNADIARILKISPASVCLLLKGSYKFSEEVQALEDMSQEGE